MQMANRLAGKITQMSPAGGGDFSNLHSLTAKP
jgi:hypothetical protein